MQNFLEKSRKKTLLKDGGMGWLLLRGANEAEVFRAYVEAGADILTANTFMPGGDFKAAIGRARKAAAGKGRFVVASIGPTYSAGQVREVAETEGIDALMFETICNVDAAIDCARAAASTGLPLMFSATLGRDGKLPCGATVREFAEAAMKLHPLSVGLNCGAGPEELAIRFGELGPLPCLKSLHPAAGLPGEYVSPERFAAAIGPLIERREVDIVGGCCGTGPAHIAALNLLR